jgi:hypothetical protein
VIFLSETRKYISADVGRSVHMLLGTWSSNLGILAMSCC